MVTFLFSFCVPLTVTTTIAINRGTSVERRSTDGVRSEVCTEKILRWWC